jgi:hypothetical protein
MDGDISLLIFLILPPSLHRQKDKQLLQVLLGFRLLHPIYMAILVAHDQARHLKVIGLSDARVAIGCNSAMLAMQIDRAML